MNYPLNETGKRIQNYVFNYSDFLGAGNFSKCYKGYNEITSNFLEYSFRGNSRYKDYRIELTEIEKTLRIALSRNRDTQKTQPSQRTQMLLNFHQ